MRPPKPLLACERDSDCSDLGARCGSVKLCEDTDAAASTDIVMVVDVPESSYAESGATLLLPRSEWKFETSANCKDARCMRLPRVVRARTRLTVGDELGALPGFEGQSGAVVASDVSYVARIRLIRGEKAYVYDAMALGLPVSPLRTTPLLPKTQGLQGVFGIQASDALAFLPSNGVYARRVTPAAWLSSSVPPLQDLIVDVSALEDEGLASLAIGGRDFHLNAPLKFPLQYDDSWSGGLRIALRDASSGAMLSTTADMPFCGATAGCEAQVEMRSIEGVVAGSLLSELRIEPARQPSGLRLRYQVYNALGAFTDVKLPRVPSVASLRVSVEEASGSQVPARVTLRSLPSDTESAFGLEVRADLLRGQSEIQLPAGSYTWRALPEDGIHGVSTGVLRVMAGGPPIVLQVAPKRVLRGQLLDPRGRPIAGAAVRLHELAGRQFETAQLPTDVTTADGHFVLHADIGNYTLAIRAPDWTELGEARLNGLVVTAEQTQQLGALRVGVPRRESLRLFDADEFLVSRAGMLVRIFQRFDSDTGVHFEPVALARTNAEGAVSLRWSTLRR